jgi:hypothetical protein
MSLGHPSSPPHSRLLLTLVSSSLSSHASPHPHTPGGRGAVHPRQHHRAAGQPGQVSRGAPGPRCCPKKKQRLHSVVRPNSRAGPRSGCWPPVGAERGAGRGAGSRCSPSCAHSHPIFDHVAHQSPHPPATLAKRLYESTRTSKPYNYTTLTPRHQSHLPYLIWPTACQPGQASRGGPRA